MSEELIEGASPEQIGQVLTNINECLLALGKRLQEVEKYVSELPTPAKTYYKPCLLYTSPSPRDATLSRMPSSA